MKSRSLHKQSCNSGSGSQTVVMTGCKREQGMLGYLHLQCVLYAFLTPLMAELTDFKAAGRSRRVRPLPSERARALTV